METGYYWRDFYGRIPHDAFAAGADINGRPIYVGQILNGTFLIPAKIYPRDNKAYYELGGKEHTTINNIKIFCTQNPGQLKWIKTSNDAIKLLTGADANLIIGGYEPGCTTYIGRARAAGEVSVGKALADNLPAYAGLYTTSHGRLIKHGFFEVLSYNPCTSAGINTSTTVKTGQKIECD